MAECVHAISVVELEFERSAADLKQVEAALAKEYDALYPKTSINPQKLLQRIEQLRAELPELEREAERIVAEKRTAIATVETLRATHATLTDTAARADLDSSTLTAAADASIRLAAAAESSRRHASTASLIHVDPTQLIERSELDMRLELTDAPATQSTDGAAQSVPSVSAAEWSSVPAMIKAATSIDSVSDLWGRLQTLVRERRDPELSMSQLVVLGLASGGDDARLHALGAMRKISLGDNAIQVSFDFGNM